MHRLSPVATSRGYSLVVVCGLLIAWLLLLWSTDSRAWGLQSLWLVGLLALLLVKSPRTRD